MKKAWKIKKLGDVCTIKPAKKLAREQLSNKDLVTFFPMANLKVFNYYINPIQTKQLQDVYKGYVYFANNDVLLAKITPCFENGKLGIANDLENGIGFGSSEYMVFRPSDSILSEYIYYFLSLDFIRREGKNRMTGAVGHKRIPIEYISNQSLIVPPLPEQKRIVKILDKAFKAIDMAKKNAEKNLQNSKELFESYLNGIFANGKLKVENGEWEEKRLGEVCKIIGGGTPSKKNKEFYNGNILWATVRDMKSNIIKITECKITENGVKNSATNIISRGNVVIATRVGLGKVCILKNDTAINQDLKGVIPNNSRMLSIDFLYRWFTNISDKIISEGTGATVQGVKLTFINSLPIVLPPLPEQKQIVKRLDKLQTETKRLENIYQQKIADVEELKKSILQKAFEGEL